MKSLVANKACLNILLLFQQCYYSCQWIFTGAAFLGVCLPCVKPSTASSSSVRRSASVLFCRFFLTLSSVSWYADAALRLPEDRSICCLAANAAPRFLPLLKRKKVLGVTFGQSRYLKMPGKSFIYLLSKGS